VLETGRNSVKPSTKPRMRACRIRVGSAMETLRG